MSVILGILRNRFSAPRLSSLPQDSFRSRTILITGASSGLGLEAARHYALLGASRIILGVRSQSRGDAAKRSILSSFNVKASQGLDIGKKEPLIDVWIVDFTSFESVQAYAKRTIDEVEQLDIAVLNAAVSKEEFVLTPDGWEETLQVNALSTVLLALLLLPKLRESSSKNFGQTSMLSIVASRAHQNVKEDAPWTGSENILDALNELAAFGGFGGRYSVSKLLLVYAVNEIVRMASSPNGDPSVIVNYSCPGACKSDLAREWSSHPIKGTLLAIFQITFCKTTEEGSRTIVLASGLGKESHGKWLHNDRFEE